MASVALQHLSKTYPADAKIPAIQDFELEVADREFVVLAGPRGCGNASVIRLIAGLEQPSKGDILIAGKRVNDLAPKDRDVAMVFRHDALYPRMTVQANLVYGLEARKFPAAEIQRRIAETARILGIEPLLDRRAGSLPEAERHRVALGKAIARQPKVFLFHEPLALLDPATAGELRAEILRLHQRVQATFIYATHDPLEAMALAGRMVVMKDGAGQQVDTPRRLYAQPDDLFVAGYLGHPRMNFVHGKLREAGDALLFKETGEGVIELKLPKTAALEPYAGREVIAGIRPEDLRIVPEAPRAGVPRFRALLDVMELKGADAHAHIETGAHRLIAAMRDLRETGDEAEAGHRAQFEIDPAVVHFFDPETTRRIPR
jgi:multiple sugar transport system ATP-binding protein